MLFRETRETKPELGKTGVAGTEILLFVFTSLGKDQNRKRGRGKLRREVGRVCRENWNFGGYEENQ